MARIISVVNQKGGVGKTTTSVNIAASLSATKRKTLLVDLDPQGNATSGSGVNKENIELSIYDLLVESQDVRSCILPNMVGGYDLISANSDLTGVEVALLDMPDREHLLGKALRSIEADYSYIFIDCPPSLNMLTINALVSADSLLIPTQCEYYALEGLSALMSTIETIKMSLNPSLKIDGLLRTMFDPRNNLALEVSKQLMDYFGDLVYRTVIPRNIRLAEAPSHGLPALLYDRSSSGASAYLALAGEMLRKESV